MLMLPVSAFAALILLYLAARILMRGRRVLAVFLLACAIQSLAVSLVGGYGIVWLRPALPVGATIIPPLAWITLRLSLFGQTPVIRFLPHAAIPAFCLFCRIAVPVAVDVVVPASFAGYGAAILLLLRNDRDLPLGRLEAGEWPRRVWLLLGGFLIASAATDILIAILFLTDSPRLAHVVISTLASLFLLALGLLSIMPEARGEPEPAEPPTTQPEPNAEDAALIDQLRLLLERERLHLDPALTLQRLARRLHVPEKRLSAAVNRTTTENVSRYINGWRVREACARLQAGATVTDAMLESGFNTKSNFNREFQRVLGKTPSAWRTALAAS